jgi:hypothetical protein
MTSRTQSLFSDYTKTFDYHLWDRSKSRKCVCDSTYGDIDCSKRLCPYGTDVLDTKDDTYYGLEEQKHQEQTILFSSLTGDFDGLAGQSFALTFKSRLNETFTTIPLAFTSEADLADIENDIKLALLKLPNGVIDGVAVTVDFIDSTELHKLTFDNALGASFTATTASSTALTSVASIQGTLSVGCQVMGAVGDIAQETKVTVLTGTTGLRLSKVTSGGALAASASGNFDTTAGSTTITLDLAASSDFAAGDYIHGPGIPPETTITTLNAANADDDTMVISNAAFATATTQAVVGYSDYYSCTMNNVVIGLFYADIAAGDQAPTTDFTIFKGYLQAGCTVTGTGTVADTVLESFTITGATLTKAAASGAGGKTLGCYKDLSYTTEGGVVRGYSADQSGNFQSGEDQTVLPGVVGNYNHRRLANTALVSIKVRFTGPSVQGPQHLLVVEDYLCGDGCTPRLSGMPLETRQLQAYWSTVVEVTKSDFNSYECGRRGKCDYSTGLCNCFAGYVGDNCNTLTTLV